MEENEQQAEIERVGAELAAQLGETAERAREELRRVVATLGVEPARTFLRQALDVEAQGGMLVMSKKRRRTLGGVFFHLIHEQVSRKLRRQIFIPLVGPGGGSHGAQAAPALTADEIATLLLEAKAWEKGSAMTVKITLVGRPGAVQQMGRPGQDAPFVAFTIEADPTKLPTLPKGLPAVNSPTTYLVLVATRQWRKVEAALNDPADRLIVEGYCSLDPKVSKMISVRATFVTTTVQQRAKRAEGAP